VGENEMVINELEFLEDDAKVFKLIGPVLVQQDLVEVKANVNTRIAFIKKDTQRVDKLIKDLEKKSEEQRQKVRGVKALARARARARQRRRAFARRERRGGCASDAWRNCCVQAIRIHGASSHALTSVRARAPMAMQLRLLRWQVLQLQQAARITQ
jgi:chaperonin cofactor prefoldin